MLERVHHHIVDELQQSARTDTIFMVAAVLFNLVVLGVNSAVAGEAANGRATTGEDITLAIFIIMTVLVNTVVIAALNTGKHTRSKLLSGLLQMYKDKAVDKYYDVSLLTNYNRRYLFFTIVILALALTAISVPLVIRTV